ncbi:MAG: hypothetical protein WKF40_07080 [Thermoleophilaceae bacterium]
MNTRLQALPGLTTTTPGSWTVKRRGVVYTISTSLCSIDDPKDGYGSHAGATYCADSATTGTADAQPEDFKRLTVDVSWARNAGTKSVRQVALIDSPGDQGAAGHRRWWPPNAGRRPGGAEDHQLSRSPRSPSRPPHSPA